MDAAFFNRMGTYHVRAGSGDCWNGITGEGFYVYTATGAVGGHLGCFMDSDGHAAFDARGTMCSSTRAPRAAAGAFGVL